jgi:plasmid stabilization system protein ParE
MSLPVVWSPTAQDEYAEILKFLDAEFGVSSALKMLEKTEEIVQHISNFPRAFPQSILRPDLRRAVVTPQISLFYRIADTQVQVLHFWDNRQNPQKIEFLI